MNLPVRPSALAWLARNTVAAAALLLLPGMALAQDEGGPAGVGSPVVTQLPVSIRSLALAGALPLASADSDLFLRNPGMAQRGRGMGLSAHRYGRDGSFVSMSGGAAWLGGGVGLAVRSAEYRAPADPGVRPPRRPGDRMRLGARAEAAGSRVSETALTAGYGRMVKGFRVGAAVSTLHLRTGPESETTGVVDLGLTRDVSRVTIGLSGGGLGPSVARSSGFGRTPKWLTAAAGTQAAPVGPLDISMAFVLTLREGSQLEAGGGLGVGWWPIQGRVLEGRLGVGGTEIREASKLSLGVGFLGDAFTLEYAWRHVSGGSGLHAAGLRFR